VVDHGQSRRSFPVEVEETSGDPAGAALLRVRVRRGLNTAMPQTATMGLSPVVHPSARHAPFALSGEHVHAGDRMTPVTVTKPLLPPLEEFMPYLEAIWESGWLTNGGPMHRRLEAELAAYLGVEHIALFGNGTLGLMLALRALGVNGGEVVTTPFTFVATAHAISWVGAVPVFVDIEPDGFNIDPERIEAAITPHTVAIMPVHVYGRPCAVEEIDDIARRHGLPVIYDAAHAFAVRWRTKSLLGFGDLAVLSFHATKVFSTLEGGAIVCRDAAMKARIDRLKNFGIADEDTIPEIGLNAKMNEVQAAFGLATLPHVAAAIARRADIDDLYRRRLCDVPKLTLPSLSQEATRNYGYFPILVGDDHPLGRDGLYRHLRDHGIMARRYFHPLVSDLPMYAHLPSARRENVRLAAVVAAQILCLPLHGEMEPRDVHRIADLIVGSA